MNYIGAVFQHFRNG